MAKIQLKDITVVYEKFTLSNISFSCNGGETLALIGRNGAGKTTTIDSIIGLSPYQSGSIYYNGEKIAKDNEHLFKQKIGYVSAVQEYYPRSIPDFV